MTKQETRTPEDLKGKLVSFFINGDGRGRKAAYAGSRMGKVVAVDIGPRKGWVGVTVLHPAPSKRFPGLTPVKLKITVKELTVTNHTTGVLWFGKVRHLSEWLTDWTKYRSQAA